MNFHILTLQIVRSFIMLALIGVFFTNSSLIGQDVLLVRRHGSVSYVFKFNIENCRFDSLGWVDPYHPVFSDHAMSPHQMIFTPDGNLYSNVAGFSYWIMLADFDWTMNFPDTIRTHYVSNDYGNGLGFDCIISNEKGHIYDMSYGLKKYYPDTDKWEFKGTQPDFYGKSIFIGYQHPNRSSLTRRGKDYYYVASSYARFDEGDSLKFIKLDIHHPSKSRELFSFPLNMYIHAVFSIQTRCREFKTYIKYGKYIKRIPSHSYELEKGALAELDINTGEITDICDFGKNSSYFTFGALSVPWTQLDSDCLLILDLDEDDSGGALSDIDYVDTVSCRLDSIHITDTDPDVFAYNPVEKLEIFFREAPPDGISEYIEAQVTSGVNITGSGTQHITLTGGTAPDYKELKTALQNLIYRNSSTNPTLGNREIAFVGNTNTITSDTAVAHIYLKDSYKSAGRDTVVQLCSDATAIELENYLSANATLGGSWDEELNTAGIFDPQTDKAGIYDYIVSSAECGEDTAHIAINVNPLPEVNLGNDTTLCHGTVLLLTPDNINAESYKWQDGNTAESYEAKVSGQYTLEVIDANGCANKDSIIISYFSQNEPTRIDTLVCKGKVINWSGVDIDTSGVFTNTTSDRNGCDSTAILHVEYSKYGSLTENDTLICQGQKIEWQGQQIDKNGDYEFTHIDAAGCDSTLILHVGLYPPVKVEIAGNTMICETGKTILIGGDYAKYKWSTGSNSKQIEVVSSGWYLLTITDEHGCNWNDSIYVSQVAPIEAKYSTEPENCYGYQDGKIKLESITGGVGNITGYLNGQEVDLKSEMINLKPDSYVLKLTDSLNCQKEIIINISAAKHIWCDIGKDINTMAGEELEIKLNHNITAVSKIEWMTYGKVVSSNESILRLKPISDTEIIVVVTDEKACEARDTMNIRIKEEIDIYIPNVFSPNGDGINDIYTIRGSKKIEYVESIDIFDRWGENIHHAEHIPFNSIKTPLWDGKYKGKGLLPGVYVYMLKVRANTGETIVKYGDLTLIK